MTAAWEVHRRLRRLTQSTCIRPACPCPVLSARDSALSLPLENRPPLVKWRVPPSSVVMMEEEYHLKPFAARPSSRCCVRIGPTIEERKSTSSYRGSVYAAAQLRPRCFRRRPIATYPVRQSHPASQAKRVALLMTRSSTARTTSDGRSLPDRRTRRTGRSRRRVVDPVRLSYSTWCRKRTPCPPHWRRSISDTISRRSPCRLAPRAALHARDAPRGRRPRRASLRARTTGTRRGRRRPLDRDR